MYLALYQPEIPQNTGTLMRFSACMGIKLAIIHPCGFIWDDRHLKRAGLDYIDLATIEHHTSWETFLKWSQENDYRLILLDAKAEIPYTTFKFQENDIILMGQESCGVPAFIFQTISQRLHIPMMPHCRSLNVSLAASMAAAEALRQLQLFPKAF